MRVNYRQDGDQHERSETLDSREDRQLLAASMDIAFAKTDTVCNSIGVRKAPRPERCAGFVRIDSAHRGDEDGMKGAYHITGLDCIAQWQVEYCVEGIGKVIFRRV